MEAIRSSETSVQSTTFTRRHIPEDAILRLLTLAVFLLPGSSPLWTFRTVPLLLHAYPLARERVYWLPRNGSAAAGNCPLCLRMEDSKDIMLKCPEARMWRSEFLCKNSVTLMKNRYMESYLCNRPWRPIGLWDVEAPTFSRQSAHRWRWG
jgi:hypothetical protein